MILIIVGGFLHVSGHPNAMAETLSLVSTSLSIAGQLRQAKSMECSLQAATEDGLHLYGTIRWLSPDAMRADLFEGERAYKSLWMEGSEIVVVDHRNNAFQKYHSLEKIEDPLFTPLVEFFSPENLAEALYKKWEPRGYGEHDKEQGGMFVYNIKGEKAMLEMTIDMNTNLPLKIKKFLPHPKGAGDVHGLSIEARFIWNKTISLEILTPKSQKE